MTAAVLLAAAATLFAAGEDVGAGVGGGAIGGLGAAGAVGWYLSSQARAERKEAADKLTQIQAAHDAQRQTAADDARAERKEFTAAIGVLKDGFGELSGAVRDLRGGLDAIRTEAAARSGRDQDLTSRVVSVVEHVNAELHKLSAGQTVLAEKVEHLARRVDRIDVPRPGDRP